MPPPIPSSVARRKNAVYATGLVGIVAFFGSFPFFAKKSNPDKNLTWQAEPLGGNAQTRGAFMNYGSKDVGKDPDWDPVTRTYHGRSLKNFSPSDEEVAEARKTLEEKRRAKEAAGKGAGWLGQTEASVTAAAAAGAGGASAAAPSTPAQQ